MYHPSRGGVRGGRDQFSWDDVKADKHRENYIGHSIKAPIGRWQKGKDLHWYVKDKREECLTAEAKKEEIQRIKEEEERAMRELLGLAPKRENRPYGTRLDKREAAELLKKGTSAEDLAPGYAEGERVQGLGFARAPHHSLSGNLVSKKVNDVSHNPQSGVNESLVKFQRNEVSRQPDGHGSDSPGEDAVDRKIRRKEEKKRRREERKNAKKDKNTHELDYKRNQRKKRRHDSDSSD